MSDARGLSLQERFAPHNGCFGCGPANDRGLGLRSFVAPAGDALVAEYVSRAHHGGFGRVLHGGVVAALFDCHANWAAAHRLMVDGALETPPSTVTADLHVTFERPTSLLMSVTLEARVVDVRGRRVVVEASLSCEGKVNARCRGVFATVDAGHPGQVRP